MKSIAILMLLFSAATLAATRQWQVGTLLETEQTKVNEGSTTTSNTDGRAKAKGDKIHYSEDTTSNTNNNQETYQIYTIQSGDKVYVVSEHLLFPWSKSANITVGAPVKFAVDRNKLYILDDDGKEHKTTVKQARMNSPK